MSRVRHRLSSTREHMRHPHIRVIWRSTHAFEFEVALQYPSIRKSLQRPVALFPAVFVPAVSRGNEDLVRASRGARSAAGSTFTPPSHGVIGTGEEVALMIPKLLALIQATVRQTSPKLCKFEASLGRAHPSWGRCRS